MRIRVLSLKNFQSHRNSVIKLSPGFNLFIGSSNEGKSSIVRSLEFLLYGDWNSDYVTTKETESTVSCLLEDKSVLEKTKGKGINKVSLKVGEEVEDYSGFGDIPPPNIIKKLGSHPIVLDDDKKLYINVAAQHDNIFLLKESGGYRSKVIGYISGVHLIDSVVRETVSESRLIESMISELDLEKRKIQKIITEYESKESQFSIIPGLEAEIEEQEILAANIRTVNNLLVSVRNYNAKIQDLKSSVENLAKIDESKIHNKFIEDMIALKQCPFCGSKMEKESLSKHICNL